MLHQRIFSSALLIAVTFGVLVADPFLYPWFPFFFIFAFGVGLPCCREILLLLGPDRAPDSWPCYLGLSALYVANWAVHVVGAGDPWPVLLAVLTGFLALIFLYEMSRFHGANRGVEKMALTWWVLGYLGLLPSFLLQLRWLYPENLTSHSSVCIAMAIFVPKFGDIGAFTAGKLFGRHRMTPILSPKKTWEGALGGIVLAVVGTWALNQIAPVLGWKPWNLLGFGVSMAVAGMAGDLAESLVKRDCQKKDASETLPGFGGILDVADSILFSAPVAFAWLAFTRQIS